MQQNTDVRSRICMIIWMMVLAMTAGGVLSGFFPLAARAETGDRMIVIAEKGIYIRSEPSEDAEITGSCACGEIVTVQEDNGGDWVLLYGGYARKEFLEEAAGEEPEEADAAESDGGPEEADGGADDAAEAAEAEADGEAGESVESEETEAEGSGEKPAEEAEEAAEEHGTEESQDESGESDPKEGESEEAAEEEDEDTSVEPEDTVESDSSEGSEDSEDSEESDHSGESEDPEADEEPEEEQESTEDTAGEEERTGEAVAEFARQFVGLPYVWGGESLETGCDCSGFTRAVYAHFDVDLPHFDQYQRNCGEEVSSIAEAKPGDLVFYENHVTLYIGNNQVINCSNEDLDTIITRADYKEVEMVRRMFCD
ncbi:MAG: SH3 domain-containing C40 family peptidase [Eubacteriales bacterium]|nr:SH3 domain-containing C40 family peptidase [Eubacteriales bacterium]